MNYRRQIRLLHWLGGPLLTGIVLAAPPVVIEPSSLTRLAAGNDFATQVLGDPWDFDRIEDTFTPNSLEIVNEAVEDGIYSFETIQTDLDGVSRAQFWLIHPGVFYSQLLVSQDRNPDSGLPLFTREKFSIDPVEYRYLTARVRMSSATAEPLEKNQGFVVYYFEDSTSIGNALYGNSRPFSVRPNEWTIVEIDLSTNVDDSGPESWSSMPQVDGLRIDPTSRPDIRVEIDWIRLTSAPVSADEAITVDWQDNGAESYSVSARALDDPDAPALELAAEVSGGPVEAELGRLPPGDYQIEVTGDGETGISPGVAAVNEVPLVNITRPNIKGDQSRGYGLAANSNSWADIDPEDVAEVLGFESWSFTNPPGSLTGRPVTESSRVLMNTPVPIDTAFYRMLCFEVEVSGPRDILRGSVTKILWGNFRAKLTTSKPVITQEGLNEYCVGDMDQFEVDPLGPVGADNEWAGPINYIRFDPHEFLRTSACDLSPSPENCRDVRFDSLVLAPFHSANPDFVFQWEDSDADDNATLHFWLDDDNVPGNTPQSLEYLIGSANENASTDELIWMPPSEIEDGQWYVYAVADDGLNRAVRYASGPLQLGSAPTAAVVVDNPDGIDDTLVAGDEYSLHDRDNPWDMDDNEIDLTAELGISDFSLSGGLLSGTASTSDPNFVLMSTANGDPEIDPLKYRYMTMKIRATNVAGPHFVQLFFGDDPQLAPSGLGFTSGKPIDENAWSFITFDLYEDMAGNSPRDWLDFSTIRGLRVDPTTKAGTRFEIDWITLSAAPKAQTAYTVQWSTENMGFSTYDVFILDSAGQRWEVAEGLSRDTRSFTTNFSHLPLGSYFAEVVARPGPVALSKGAIDLVRSINVTPPIFADGFEEP